MKRFMKSFLLSVILLLTLAFIPVSAQAANYTPGQVKNLKATTAESAVTLKWKKVSNAAGYNIYLLNEDNTFTRVARTKTVTCTLKKLKNNVTYTYYVAAYRTVSSKTYEGKKSSPVKATPQVKKPSVPSVSVSACKDQKITLKWNKISGASGYEVYQKDASTGKFVSIGNTKNTSVTVKNLTNGTNYQFKVRAYRKVSGVTRYGNFSSAVTAKPVKVTSKISSITTMWYKAKTRSTVKAELADGSGKKVTVKAGSSVTVTSRGKTCTVRLNNNKKVYMSSSNLSYQSCVFNSKTDLSRATKEGYVNSKGYSSSTKYLIWVSLQKQHLYIFKGSQCNWTLYKSYLCSSGKASTPTPKGLYRIRRKSYFMPFDAYSYANYASYFSGNAIHTWVKLYSGGLYHDGVLGQPASHGCVRLSEAGAVMVYNKIPVGTTVVIY